MNDEYEGEHYRGWHIFLNFEGDASGGLVAIKGDETGNGGTILGAATVAEMKAAIDEEYALIRQARDVMADAANALDAYARTMDRIAGVDAQWSGVLSWLDERGRNSRSYGSHADAYEIAARKLREALGAPEPTPFSQIADDGPTAA